MWIYYTRDFRTGKKHETIESFKPKHQNITLTGCLIISRIKALEFPPLRLRGKFCQAAKETLGSQQTGMCDFLLLNQWIILI